MSVEALKSFFDVGTVVLLFLAFAFGAGVLITGNIINSRQNTQIRQFDKDLTSAKAELVKQQERAANAERDAAEAKTTAATAERSLLELQQRIKGRALSPSQRANLQESLFKGPKGTIKVSCASGDSEACVFAREIASVFTASGWTLWDNDVGQSPYDLVGIFIHFKESTPQSTAIEEAFSSINMPLARTGIWAGPETSVEILVGRKPLP
jgi:hypothetical protein